MNLAGLVLGILMAQEPWFDFPFSQKEPLAGTKRTTAEVWLIGEWHCGDASVSPKERMTLANLTLSRGKTALYNVSFTSPDPDTPSVFRDRPAEATTLGRATFLSVAMPPEEGSSQYIFFRYERDGYELRLRVVGDELRGTADLSADLLKRADDPAVYAAVFACDKSL